MKNAKVSPLQLRDTAMAMTLLMLIVYAVTDIRWFFIFAIIFLLLGMTVTKVMKPFAIAWYAFAEILGGFVSKVLLAIIFILIVLPVALFRKILGKDALRLKLYSSPKSDSCFVTRNYTYSSKDFDKTY